MKSIAREIRKTTVTEDGNTDGPRKMILITTTFPLFIKKAVPISENCVNNLKNFVQKRRLLHRPKECCSAWFL